MTNNERKSYLERFLSIFSEVRKGEGVSAVLLFFSLFFLLTAYYIIKPVRESWILAESGAEIKAYAAAGMLIIFSGSVSLYGWLSSRFARRPLINIVNIFFIACLVVFFFLAQTNIPLGIVFFLWIGVFNMMVVSQFWSFSNDLYTPEAGKRIFVIIAFGASSGAVFGSFITGQIVEPLGVNQLLLVSAALLVISLILTNIVDSRQKRLNLDADFPTKVSEPLEKANGFKLVIQNKYLLLIALLMLFLNWVNTTGEFILGWTVEDAAKLISHASAQGASAQKLFITKFYAEFFTIVNLVGLLLQLFLVSRILKYLGVRIAIIILPLIAFFGYFAIAFFPILSLIRWIKIAENATDYSLQNTVRHVLFLPTTREEKYNAKQAIDTFFVRAGDVLQAVLVFVGLRWFGFQVKDFALFNMGLVTIWLIIAYFIGKQNSKLTAQISENG
jgi:ATP:ADP antiporter, AAA family